MRAVVSDERAVEGPCLAYEVHMFEVVLSYLLDLV